MVQELREAALIHTACSGQVSAFNQLVRDYQGLVYNLAYRILGDSQMAIDVTQGTFLRAAQRLSRMRQGSVMVWLMRILVETCRAWLSCPEHPAAPGLALMLAEDRQAVSDHPLREYRGEALQSCINRLPPEQRIVLVLSDVGDLDYSEIAASTGVPVKIVKSHLSQGRAALRDALWSEATPLPTPVGAEHARSYRTQKRAVG
jgi:RNA polymerase sigma-70 factor (ECF subfamily)